MLESTGRNLPPTHGSLKVHPRKVFGLGLILSAMLGRYRQRSILALTLMVAQSFLYNSVRAANRVPWSKGSMMPTREVPQYRHWSK